MDTLQADSQVQAIIARMLLRDEVVLWVGHPTTGIRFTPADIFHIPFGMLFFGGSLIFTFTALRYVCPALVGLIFVWIGYQLAIGRFISDARLRRRSTYVLTSQRALIICLRPGRMEIGVGTQLDEIRRIDLHLHNDGSGSIAMSTDTRKSELSSSGIRLWPSDTLEGLFQYVDEPIQIVRKIRAACYDLTGNTIPTLDDPESYLDPDETPLWSGQPRQGFFLCKSDLIAIPFSVAWLSGVVAFARTSFRGPKAAHGIGLVYVIALFAFFCIVGLFAVIGRFFIEISGRRNTHYAITPRRLLIANGKRPRRVVSLELKEIESIQLTKHADRTGTLTFDRPVKAGKQVLDLVQFQRITKPEEVRGIIQERLKKS